MNSSISIVFARQRQCAPASKTCFLGFTRVYNQNGISIGSAVFARVMIVTDRHTDRQTTLLRADHYIFILWFLLSIFLSSFFPRLISAVADWMSTILPHIVWPWCEFRMHVWNVLHAARCKYRKQKNRHFGTIAQFCPAVSSQLMHVSTVGKKFVKQQYLLHMSSKYGEPWPTNGWDQLASLGHPCKFQRLSRLIRVVVLTQYRRVTDGQTDRQTELL